MTTTNQKQNKELVGGEGFEAMLKAVDVQSQIKALQVELKKTRSVSKKDSIIKKLKYLQGLKNLDMKPDEAYILRNLPVVPPIVRPVIRMGGAKNEFNDVNYLYRDHMSINENFGTINKKLDPASLINERKDFYNGAKAVFGLGDAVTGSSRGKELQGFVTAIAGKRGPKSGYFHSKLLSKKQDFSARATIYAEPKLGFNQVALPADMAWSLYDYHLTRELVNRGYNLLDAKKEIETKGPAATSALNHLIKTIPVLVNRAPTLLRGNITAHYPVLISGKAMGINPLHLPLYAGDFDGDALSVYLPITPEAINEAKKNLLVEAHIHDYRKGHMASMLAPGHEAVLGAVQMTTPDKTQKPVTFDTEVEALKALHEGRISETTPLIIKEHAEFEPS